MKMSKVLQADGQILIDGRTHGQLDDERQLFRKFHLRFQLKSAKMVDITL